MGRPKTIPITEIGQRFEAAATAVEARDGKDALAVFGTNTTSWHGFLTGTRQPKLEVLIRMRLAGIDLNWLATGEGDMFGQSPFSDEQWADVISAVAATVTSSMSAEQKTRSLVGYLRGLLDVPQKPDNIPSAISIQEAANDGRPVQQGSKRGSARNSPRK